MKGYALGLALKKRRNTTRKSPICRSFSARFISFVLSLSPDFPVLTSSPYVIYSIWNVINKHISGDTARVLWKKQRWKSFMMKFIRLTLAFFVFIPVLSVIQAKVQGKYVYFIIISQSFQQRTWSGVKPGWPNGLASRSWTCVRLAFRLTTHLCWLEMTFVDFGQAFYRLATQPESTKADRKWSAISVKFTTFCNLRAD